jgi:hypothetical protein
MQTQLYFWKPLMKKHKQELSLVEYYFNKTKVQFENIEKEANSHAEEIFSAFSNENIDSFTAAEWATEKGMEMYETLSIIKLNHLLMTISMLYHIWEQQLVRFTIRELRHYLTFREKALSYKEVQKVFQLHGVNIIDTMSWGKIQELKSLSNTIKHGDGDSAAKLRKIRPDFFRRNVISDLDDIDEIDSLEMGGSVLLDQYSLQVNEQDLYTYINATRDFWDEMPERAYANVDIVIETLNSKKL